MVILAYARLVRAGFVLAREGALSLAPAARLTGPARLAVGVARLIERPSVKRTGRVERLSRALNRLGPPYVKFGQSLATRPDIVGPDIARDLSALHDRMAPFDDALVPGILSEALGEAAGALRDISPPVAAASIAQVHKAVLVTPGGRETVAVKILRPGVEAEFRRDLKSFFEAARLLEALVPAMRRLRPVDVVRTLERSAALELDLRLEAASISEFAENTRHDGGFAVPEPRWTHTAQNVLTTTWLDGIPVHDLAGLDAAGVDRKQLAETLLRAFLHHSVRDGFFHADMHPGNLFADPAGGGLLAVDFGIMGRLSRRERRFLADILYGFITRNYRMIAERHFEIGYVPEDQSVEDFALALRSIGEPLHGHNVGEISMARVLGQLFAVTAMFSMRTQPQVLLLQKNMVLVEGVARMLDPRLDIWTVAEPVLAEWVARHGGPLGRLEETSDSLRAAARSLSRLPGMIDQADRVLKGEAAVRVERTPLVPRWMVHVGFWVVMAASVAVTASILL